MNVEITPNLKENTVEDVYPRPKREYIWQNGFESNRFFFLIVSSLLIIVMMAPFLSALTVSIIFVMAQIQAKKKLQGMPRLRRHTIIGSLIAVFLFLGSMIIYCFYTAFENAASFTNTENRLDLLKKINSIIIPFKDNLVLKLSAFFPHFDFSRNLDGKINELFLGLANVLAAGGISILAALPDILLLLFFSLIAYFVLIRRYHDLKFYALLHFPEGHLREKLRTFWTISERSAYSAIVSTISVSSAQGVIISLGALAAGIGIWPAYFVVGFVFSFFPVVGLLPVIVFGLSHAFILFGFKSSFIFLLFGIISTVTDNLLRALMTAKESSEINTYISFFCLIGSMYVFGISGIVLGPFFISFASLLKKQSRELKEADKKNTHKPAPSTELLKTLGFFKDKT